MNKILTEYYSAADISKIKAGVLEQQTHRIVVVITNFFGKSNYWWSYSYYEGDILPEPSKVIDNIFQIYINKNCESANWCYNEGFPVVFFDMSNDEIWKYLSEEAMADEMREKILKEMNAAVVATKKLTKAALTKSALAKLTPQEKKVLKL